MKIGDSIRFKNITNGVRGTRIPVYYTEGDGIPIHMIKHGDVCMEINKGKIVNIYDKYYIIEYVDVDNHNVRLGFLKEDFEIINQTLKSLLED